MLRSVSFRGALVLLVALVSAPARADEGDGLYGRFDGDLVLSAGVGGGGSLGTREGAVALVEARARYLDCAGPFLLAEIASQSRLGFGIELRPLFPALFLMNLFTGEPALDLFLGSLAIELGVAIGPLDDQLGAALSFGGSLEIPIVVGTPGVGVRVGARYVHAPIDAPQGPDVHTSDVTLSATLIVRGQIDAGIATWEPRRYERR